MEAERVSTLVVETVLDPDVFELVFLTQDPVFATLQQLALCQSVCRAWCRAVQGWRGGHSLYSVGLGEAPGWVGESEVFARFTRRAVLYVVEFDGWMGVRWREYVALVNDNWSAGIEMEYKNHTGMFTMAVLALAHGLEDHAQHRAVVCACVTELQDIVQEMEQWEDCNAQHVVRSVVWHLFRVLQAHRGDAGLGLLVLDTLRAILVIDNSGNIHDQPILDPARAPAARLAVTAFVRSCPASAGLGAAAAVVLGWLEEGSLLLLCHHPAPRT